MNEFTRAYDSGSFRSLFLSSLLSFPLKALRLRQGDNALVGVEPTPAHSADCASSEIVVGLCLNGSKHRRD